MESITLYFKQGGSDKVYQVRLEPAGEGWVVNFAYGRRGSTMTTGTKTPTAVNYDAAKAIYDQLVNEKKAKGYTRDEDGTPYQHSDKTNTGIHCQLLNAIDEEEANKLIADPCWSMQEKIDGRRLILHKQGDEIIGINRLGLEVALPKTLIDAAKNCPLDYTIDGEGINDWLFAFDLLAVDGDDIREWRFADRYLRLMNLLASFHHHCIGIVQTATNQRDKVVMMDRLHEDKCEGVVFKHVDGHYVPGRPNSGGTQLKYKFCETASFIVASVNGKRSVKLKLLNGKSFVDAGNVTVPANHTIPAPGSVVEVRYLYAFKESGCIYQPVFLGVRDDIGPAECLVSQLKYKAEQPEPALA
jgi:bifunctional non-homologous end joining protein LigD